MLKPREVAEVLNMQQFTRLCFMVDTLKNQPATKFDVLNIVQKDADFDVVVRISQDEILFLKLAA